jgi:hypothetical protein
MTGAGACTAVGGKGFIVSAAGIMVDQRSTVIRPVRIIILARRMVTPPEETNIGTPRMHIVAAWMLISSPGLVVEAGLMVVPVAG